MAANLSLTFFVKFFCPATEEFSGSAAFLPSPLFKGDNKNKQV
jgi:hypothetical protein